MLEILAPAGDFQSLKAAVCCGATSVYVGFSRFSARQSAVNFDNNSIIEAINYCHLRGVKIYCVINTLIKDSELDTLYKDIDFLYKEGIDAIILQDLAVMRYIRTYLPELPVFASTQMTAYNLDGVRFLENFGFKRVILSRELSKEDIKYIAANTNLEIEIFGHGAICMCYSGQCHMSSVIAERSGNRGRCAQPCRLAYDLVTKNNKTLIKGKTLLSPKDMCLIDHLKEISDIGVHSLKIEGRMKNPTYVGAVTKIYSKYVNSDTAVGDEDRQMLVDVFSRGGFTDGYFTNNTGKNMMQPDSLTDSKITYNKEAEKTVNNIINRDPRKIPVNITASLTNGHSLCVTVEHNGLSVTQNGTVTAQKAETKPLTSERLKEQLLKLGQTTFECSSFRLKSFDNDIIIPISEINNVRRLACEKLSTLITDSYKRMLPNNIKPNIPYKTSHTLSGFSAQVMTLEQATEVLKHNFKRLYVPLEIYDKVSELNNTDTLICVIAPEILHDSKSFIYDRIRKGTPIYVTNIGHIHRFKNHPLYGSFRLNVFNSESCDEYSKHSLNSLCVSPELTLKEVENIHTLAEKEMIIYGRIPAMITQNCALSCSCRKGNDKELSYLKDKKGYMFPVITDCSNCTNIVLNSAAIYMADKYKDLEKSNIDTGLFMFTIESAKECKTIIEDYKNKNSNSPKLFTRGHLYKKVL